MKKLLLLMTVVGVGYFTSCKPEPPEPPEEELVTTVWRTTDHYFSTDVGFVMPEENRELIEQDREVTLSVSVSEPESFQLAFRNNGTGFGSALNPEDQAPYDFSFTWQSSDNELTISQDGTEFGFGGFVYYYPDHLSTREEVVWNIEERTEDRLVLSKEGLLLMDGTFGSWWEYYTYRYTFERVE